MNIMKATVPNLVYVALHIDPVIKLGPPKICIAVVTTTLTQLHTQLGVASVLIYPGLFLALVCLCDVIYTIYIHWAMNLLARIIKAWCVCMCVPFLGLDFLFPGYMGGGK